MDNNLISLEEYNKQKIQQAIRDQIPPLNGIACPKCGKEMYDSNPGVSLLSSPPKKNVACTQCDYRGYAFK